MKYKLTIGFITYGEYTLKYLPVFLSSLQKQTHKDIKLIAVDASKDDKNLKILNKYPEIEILYHGANLGFGKAHNKMINRAKELDSEHYLTLNPDMKLEPDTIEKMMDTMKNNTELGSISPKILKWDHENGRNTNIIDTLGIEMRSGLRFFDIAQGQDVITNKAKQSRETLDILGPSGAAAMYRMSALEKIKDANGYFDELMFMYKEDVDLAYRLFLAGFKSKCVTDAIIYHDRTVSGSGTGDMTIAINRKNKSKQSKKWSFLYQNIIFIKYWRLQNFRNKSAIMWYQLKMVVYAILLERYLLEEFVNLWKIRKKIVKY